MSVVTVGPDSIISNESEQGIKITDHDYFRAIHRITPFLDEVTNYISGFVVKKILKKVNCNTCHKYLIDDSKHIFKLISEKDRHNALIKPSQDIVEICQETETVF